MTDYERLVVGIEIAITLSEERINEAYNMVERQHVCSFTENHRRLLKAQLGFYTKLTTGKDFVFPAESDPKQRRRVF